jgi:hypothetical protein
MADTPKTPDTPDNPADATGTPCQLVLVKKDQRWLIRYRPGEERKVVASLAEAAGDPNSKLTWFDAAVLCHQMGGNFHQQLKDFTGQ